MKKTIHNLQRIFSQKSDKLRSFLIFPAILVGLLNGMIVHKSISCFVVFFYMSLRVVKSKQKTMIMGCLGSVLVSIFCFNGYMQQRKSRVVEMPTKEYIGTYEVVPDTILLRGDYVRFEGIDTQTKQKALLSKNIEDENERVFWGKQTKYIIITPQIELQEVDEQRNLHGFDYQNYLKQNGFSYVAKIQQIQKSQEKKSYQPWKLVKIMRRHVSCYVQRQFSPKIASYMHSLLMGIKDEEFKENQKNWRKIGLLHFFSISGMHVLFFSGLVRYLLLRVGICKETVFWWELSFLACLLVFTGMSTSVGRSVLFLSMIRSNQRFKWKLSSLDCWSVTFMVASLCNPMMIITAAGQLSFVLSLAIIFLQPIIATLPNRQVQSFCFSFCLSVLSFPLLSYHFFEWNILSTIMGFLCTPLFGYVILPVLTLLLPLSSVFPNIRWTLVETGFGWFESLCERVADVSAFHIVTGRLSFLFYLLCVLIILRWFSLSPHQWFHRVCLFCILFFLLASGKFVSTKGLLAFVDVGQGDSIFIQTPFHRQNILIDTGGRVTFPMQKGSTKQRTNAELTLLPLLKSQGVKQLDKVFITHGDYDHMGDLAVVSDEVKVKEVIYPKGTERKKIFQQTLTNLAQKQVKCTAVLQGEMWSFDTIQLQSLYPLKEGEGENNDSLVLLGQIGQKNVLLTGDLEEAGEHELLHHYQSLSVDILKAGHHGSQTSSSALFLKKIQPSEVILSCGKNNRYNHPHPDVMERLQERNATIYRTDRQGMIYYQWQSFQPQLGKAQWVKKED